jgi:hypothetical protein
MGIDRGGPCDTGESVDTWLARNKRAEQERNLRQELQLTEDEVTNLKESLTLYCKKPSEFAPELVINKEWIGCIKKLIHDWKLMREKF